MLGQYSSVSSASSIGLLFQLLHLPLPPPLRFSRSLSASLLLRFRFPPSTSLLLASSVFARSRSHSSSPPLTPFLLLSLSPFLVRPDFPDSAVCSHFQQESQLKGRMVSYQSRCQGPTYIHPSVVNTARSVFQFRLYIGL